MGQTFPRSRSAQATQNVHSNEQIRAASESGGRSTSQHSQLGRISSMGSFFSSSAGNFRRGQWWMDHEAGGKPLEALRYAHRLYAALRLFPRRQVDELRVEEQGKCVALAFIIEQFSPSLSTPAGYAERQAAFRFAEETRCIIRYERSFFRPDFE